MLLRSALTALAIRRLITNGPAGFPIVPRHNRRLCLPQRLNPVAFLKAKRALREGALVIVHVPLRG